MGEILPDYMMQVFNENVTVFLQLISVFFLIALSDEYTDMNSQENIGKRCNV